MSSLRLLIADDEPLIRLGLRSGLSKIGGVEVIGECASSEETIDAIRSNGPDAIFLDIQMPGCSGLDLIERVTLEHMPMVVFVTAFDEYAVKAFELHAIDYLLKPFNREKLERSVERIRERLEDRSHRDLASRLKAILDQRSEKYPDRITVRNGNRCDFVAVNSIDWIESANNYVQLHCGERSHLLAETMTGLGNKLDSRVFVRIHRCRIVNIHRIVTISNLGDETFKIELRNGAQLTSGRQFKNAIHSLLRR
jgi:two-component system, LytTR family, response regulator